MPEFGYSWSTGARHAKAMGIDINASYKDLSQVCAAIKGKTADAARSLLEKASAGEVPILFKRFNKKLGHRRELGGRKGRWPRKAASEVLKVLENAAANASFKGLGEPLLVAHACANKMGVLPRLQSKGRRIRSDLETAKVEVILVEAPGAKPVARKEEKKEKKEERKEKIKAVA
ncbi:MAG: 50S ribosomal protein L22 [Candidatus Micrarchaeia archaeon]